MHAVCSHDMERIFPVGEAFFHVTIDARGMLKHILNFFFPIRSLAREEEGEWIRPNDERLLRSNPTYEEKLALQQRGILNLDRLVAYGSYDALPLLRSAVQTFKYKRVPSLGMFLGQLMVRATPLLRQEQVPVLCPVPLHWSRHFARGFNQATLLAESVGAARGWKVRHILMRTRPTGHQAWRNRAQRRSSVKDAFAVRGNAPMPYSVVLVDDIATTGSTLDACARVLKEAGVVRVEALVLALG